MADWNEPFPILTGFERFLNNGAETELNLLDFWRFQYSNVWSLQGDIAEFIVAKALEIEVPFNRNGWSLYDIDYRSFRIEVKQTSDWHSWNKPGYVQKKHVFGITKAHDKYKVVKSKSNRQNDIYVFCHLKGNDAQSANPLNLSAWDFYVIPTKLINERCGDSKTISLSRVKSFVEPVSYDGLRDKVDAVVEIIMIEKGLYPIVEWLMPCSIFDMKSSYLYEDTLKELGYNLDIKHNHFDFPYDYFNSQLKDYKDEDINVSSTFCKKEYLRFFELGFMFGATKRHVESKQFVFPENNPEETLTRYKKYTSIFMCNLLQLKKEEFDILGERLYERCFLRVDAKEILNEYPSSMIVHYDKLEQFRDEMKKVFELGYKLAFISES